MWCNEVQEGLPLLDPDDPEAAEVLAHAEACAACREHLHAYRADERALTALKGERGAPPLAGFADGVMARLREAGPAAPLPLPLELAGAPAPLAEPRGELISFRGSLPTLAALAAAVMVTVGLLLTAPGAPLPAPQRGLAREPAAPHGSSSPVEPQVARDPAPTATPPTFVAGEALPAPALVERDPLPRRRVGPGAGGRGMDVVPVDGGAGTGMGGMRPEELSPELRRMLERALPGLQRLFPAPPPPEKRPDEVRF